MRLSGREDTEEFFFEATFISLFTQSKFLIPDTKGTYNWGFEQCNNLWNEYIAIMEGRKKEKYNLGRMVFWRNENGEKVVFDGHQRIVTMYLLFRAIYKKFEVLSPVDLEDFTERQQIDITRLSFEISSMIWVLDFITQKIINKNKILITINNDDNKEIFYSIMEKGFSLGENNYSNNYRFFVEKCNSLTILDLVEFCITLFGTKVLPVECDTLESANTYIRLENNVICS